MKQEKTCFVFCPFSFYQNTNHKENKKMAYQDSKVYFDGGHYIAVPKENFPSRKGRNIPKKNIPQTDTKKIKFETAYAESQALPKRERKQYIAEQLKDEFISEEQTKDYVKQQTERKRNNACKRYTRLWRKVYLQGTWNFFVTFTYDNEKHTEQTFQKTLRNTLKHLVSRKGWKYIGVWERSSSERLHFHGIFYIPENAMVGELKQVSDYSTKQRRIQTTYQNTHFLQKFGRNDFKEINKNEIVQSVRYLLKYIEKSGEKLVYGGDLPTYFKSDIMDEDIACSIGVDDRKKLLFDNFNCWDEGCLIGKVSPETISQLRKCN